MNNISKFVDSSINYIFNSFRPYMSISEASKIGLSFAKNARESMPNEEKYYELLVSAIKEKCEDVQRKIVLDRESTLRSLAKRILKREIKIFNPNYFK